MRADREKALVGIKSPTILKSVLHDLPDSACWPWQGFISPRGYGYGYEPGTLRRTSGHRLVWSLLVGPLTSDQVLDHICHNPDICHGADECPHRACVNPSHLRVSTLAENTMRGDSPVARNAQKTHCKNGHRFSEENTRMRKGGGRSCRACDLINQRRYSMDRGAKPRKRRVDVDQLGA